MAADQQLPVMLPEELTAVLLQAIAIVHQEEHCCPSQQNLNEAWSFFNSDLSSSSPHAQQRVESMQAALQANSKLMSFRFYAAYICLQVEEFWQKHHVILSPWVMQVFTTAAKIMDPQITSLPAVETLTIDAQSTRLAQSPGVFKELHTQAAISEGNGKRAYLQVFGLIQRWLANRSQAARDDLYYIESSNTQYPQRLHYDRDPKSLESSEEYFLLYFPLSGALWVGGGTGRAERKQVAQNGAFFGHGSRCLHGAAAYPGKNGRLFWQTTTRPEEQDNKDRIIYFAGSN